MDPVLLRLVTQTFGLGQPATPPQRITGGLLNTMWRVQTDSGSYAVKVLASGGAPMSFRHDDAFRLEQAAIRKGVQAPRPIANPISGGPIAILNDAADITRQVLVHEWVNASPATDKPIDEGLAFRIGHTVGTIHSIDLQVPLANHSDEQGMPSKAKWVELVEDSLAANKPWAAAFASSVDAIAEASRLIDDLSSAVLPSVFTHGDVNRKNLMIKDDRPVLVDWEAANHWVKVHELGGTALSLANRGGGEFEPEVVASFLNGYRSAGQALPPVSAHWLVTRLANPTHFLMFNVSRSLSATAADEDSQMQVDSNVSMLIGEITQLVENFDHMVAVLADAASG